MNMLKKGLIGLVVIAVLGGGIGLFYQSYQLKQEQLLQEAEKRTEKTFMSIGAQIEQAQQRDEEKRKLRESRIAAGTAIVEEVVKYHPNGQMYEKYVLIDNKEEGPYLRWYKSGQKSDEWNFKYGRSDGVQRGFHDNLESTLASEEFFDNGREVGDHYSWHEDGSLRCHRFFTADTPISAEIMEKKNWKKCWYENGQIDTDEHYNPDTNLLDYKEWYRNGQLKTFASEGYSIEKKKMILSTKGWYENGQPKQDFNYVSGNFDGWNRQWKENGELITNEYWVDGQIDRDKTDPKYIREEYKFGRKY